MLTFYMNKQQVECYARIFIVCEAAHCTRVIRAHVAALLGRVYARKQEATDSLIQTITGVGINASCL